MRGAGRPGRRRRGADPSSLDRGARGPGQPGAGRRTAGGAPGRRAGRARRRGCGGRRGRGRRGLLAAQADGRRAGPGLPLQGPVASAAWQRYLESFSQPIPQWFGERIEDNVGGSGGGGG
ncbi:DUF3613 domain-containing protein [Bordetella pertussis]|nr:PF12266 family protein [Bordetella pertussis 2356847]ETH36637.1 PF12266 family protein [Bordetella pertussis H897]ETH45580.1 PF12266 family protein [Bordetella pertussis H921]ETH50152.1 PF12266 family protein [Bordetella pertussis H973]ETH64265.1 PF12266 family protein [Bordetella pertussis I176]ETH69423.1 PF12266 family protein [Bordetella pertussis STO1-CHLA-0011]ETH75449.1 PF12266 family protein [Bordetella pertussis STO1-CHOC-0008]ETH85356.1 PF12266 family protein [Bordetella pertussi